MRHAATSCRCAAAETAWNILQAVLAACPALFDWFEIQPPQWQVHVMEDDEQQIHFRNLNKHLANNEEDALNLVSGN